MVGRGKKDNTKDHKGTNNLTIPSAPDTSKFVVSSFRASVTLPDIVPNATQRKMTRSRKPSPYMGNV